MTKKNSKRGLELGSVLGLTNISMYEAMLSQFEAIGYEVYQGSGDDYVYLEVTNPKEEMKEEGDKSTCLVFYFDKEGKVISSVKILKEEVEEVIIEKRGKYVW